MKTVAYLRISTCRQDLDSQRLSILDYSHRTGLTVDEFVEVQVSSRRSTAARGIHDLLERLNSGDLLLVSELSRLGRSVGEIIRLVDKLVRERVRLVSIKENIRLDGKQDLQTKIMITLISLFSEIERDLISERTREGLAAARSKGRRLGRPRGSLGRSKLTGREEEIRILLSKSVSKSSIAKIMDVSRTALLHFIASRELSSIDGLESRKIVGC